MRSDGQIPEMAPGHFDLGDRGPGRRLLRLPCLHVIHQLVLEAGIAQNL